LKYIACSAYTAVLVAFIGITALLTGLCYRGWGGLFVFAPVEKIFALYEGWPGLWRYLEALPLLALALMTISSLAFLFSCCNVKPATATIATLSVIFLDSIFRNIPYFESLQPYFITTHIATWTHIFEAHVPWWTMAEDYAYLLGLDFTFLIVGLAIFEQRDFKA